MRHLSAFVKAEPGSRRGAENFSSKNHFVVYDFVFWGFGQSYCRSSNNFECFLIFFFFLITEANIEQRPILTLRYH